MNLKNIPYKFISTFLLLFFVIPVSNIESAELSIKTLTLEECINIALEKSFEIRFLQSDLERDEQNASSWRAYLRSNAHINFYLPTFSQEFEEVYDSEADIFKFVYTKRNKYLTNLTINQPISTNGNFSLNYAFFYEEQLNDVRNFSNSFFLEFVQPIFTANTLKMSIDRAELSLRNTQLNYESRKLNIIHSVIANFFQLYEKFVSYDIQASETKQRESAVLSSREKIKTGEISEMELIQLEVAFLNSKAELIKEKSELDEYSNWFKQFVGLETEGEIRVIPNLDFIPEKIDPESVIKKGLENNVMLKQQAIWAKFAKYNVIEAQQRNKFKGNISLNIGLDRKRPYLYDSFSRFDRTNSIVLNFNFPLWDWGRNRAQIASAKAWLRRRELNLEDSRLSVERNIRRAVKDINQATNRLNVLRSSQENAQKSYNLMLEKFDKGDVSAQDLMNSQKRLTRSKLSYMDAITDYQRAVADLQKREQGGYGGINIYRPGGYYYYGN